MKVYILICEDTRRDGGGVTCEGAYASHKLAHDAMMSMYEGDKSDLSLYIADCGVSDENHCHIETRTGGIYYDILERRVEE